MSWPPLLYRMFVLDGEVFTYVRDSCAGKKIAAGAHNFCVMTFWRGISYPALWQKVAHIANRYTVIDRLNIVRGPRSTPQSLFGRLVQAIRELVILGVDGLSCHCGREGINHQQELVRHEPFPLQFLRSSTTEGNLHYQQKHKNWSLEHCERAKIDLRSCSAFLLLL